MTVRAVILGLLGAVFVGAIAYFNDVVMHQTYLFTNYMPLFLYGAVILFVVLANPLLARVSKRSALSGGEIALIIAIILPSCYIGSRSLIHRLTGHLMAPRFHNLTEPGWQQHDLLDRVPSVMLAGVRPEFDADDIRDPQPICESLAGRTDLARWGEKALRDALDKGDKEALVRALDTLESEDEECREAAAAALNRLLPRRDLFEPKDFEGVALPRGAELLLGGEPLPERKVRRLNRELVDTVYAGRLRSRSSKEDLVVKGFQLGRGRGRRGQVDADHVARAAEDVYSLAHAA